MRIRAAKVLAAIVLTIVFCALAINYRFERLNRGSLALKTGDYQAALKDLGPLASWGDNDAQYIIAQMHARGLGVERSATAAFEWLRRADAKKAADAALFIAKDYANGAPAIKPDQGEAVKWFRIAAENGSREAAEVLRDAYTNGLLGLPKDSKQADFWLNKVPGR